MWLLFFCKQKTAYEMRISDWSSDVCSSDLMVAVASRGRSYRRPCVEIPAQESWMILIHEIDREPRMFEYEIEKAGAAEEEIGRESCRERVCQYEKISVVVVLLKKKQDK